MLCVNHVFHIVVKALCRLDFALCFQTLVTFIHIWGYTCSSRRSSWCVQSDEVLLFPCMRLLVVKSLFSISINSSEIFSNLPKDFECVLPTKGTQVDTLIFLTDGWRGSLNVQVHVLRLPKNTLQGACVSHIYGCWVCFTVFYWGRDICAYCLTTK